MYLILDTNILHQEGLVSRNMQRLERFAKTGRLRICVPELVLREFITRKVADSIEALSKSYPVMHEIPRKLPGSTVADLAVKMMALNKSFEEEVENDYTMAVSEWAVRLKVEILKFGPETVERVFDDYFQGGGAFRGPKKRDDIPDSFIAYSILPVAERGGHVAVVVKDGVLKSYFRTIKGLEVFDGLAEYFEAEPFKILSEEVDTSTRNIDEIKTLLTSGSASDWFVDFVKHDEDGLAYIYVEEDSIEGTELLGIDAYAVSVNGTRPEHVTEICLGNAEFVDAGFFSIELEIKAYANLNYVASYMDYASLQPPRNTEVEMSSMNGDGWADLGEVRKVLLKGFLQIKFDPRWSARDIEPHLRYLKSENSAVGVELEVTLATIL